MKPARALLLLPWMAAPLAFGCHTPSDAPPSSESAVPASASAPQSSSAAATTAALAPSDLGIVAEAPDPFWLYPVKGAAFVDAAGFLAVIGDGPLKQSPATMKGLEKGASGKIAGAWPDSAWMLGDAPTKWIKDRWVDSQLLREGETLLDITAWGDDRAVAAIAMPNNDMRFFLVGGKPGVVMPAPSGPPKATVPAAVTTTSAATAIPTAAASPSSSAAAPPTAPTASAAARASGAPSAMGAPSSTGSPSSTGAPSAMGASSAASVVAPTPPPTPAPVAPSVEEVKPDEDACKVRMKPEGVKLSGLPTGELFTVGYECLTQGRGAAIVERWDAKKVHGSVDTLPKPEGDGGIDVRGVLARAPGDAYAYGNAGDKAYLSHFDGKTWKIEAVAFAGPVTQMMASDDGTLFAVAGALYKKPASGAWSEVALPKLNGETLVAQTVWPHTAKDLWVAAATARGEGALLRSGTTAAVMKLPSRKTMTDMVTSNRRFYATAACDKVFAHLTTVGPSKGQVPKDFPQIKEAFAGEKDFADVKFIVEDDGANLYIGAQVPTLELAQKVLARYKEKNPKALPNIFCHEPVSIKKAIAFE